MPGPPVPFLVPLLVSVLAPIVFLLAHPTAAGAQTHGWDVGLGAGLGAAGIEGEGGAAAELEAFAVTRVGGLDVGPAVQLLWIAPPGACPLSPGACADPPDRIILVSGRGILGGRGWFIFGQPSLFISRDDAGEGDRTDLGIGGGVGFRGSARTSPRIRLMAAAPVTGRSGIVITLNVGVAARIGE